MEHRAPKVTKAIHHNDNKGTQQNTITTRFEMEASVARCLRTPLAPATEQDLNRSSHTAIKQRDEPPHSCHLQLVYQPDNGGTMPGKKINLYALVDPVSPPS